MLRVSFLCRHRRGPEKQKEEEHAGDNPILLAEERSRFGGVRRRARRAGRSHGPLRPRRQPVTWTFPGHDLFLIVRGTRTRSLS